MAVLSQEHCNEQEQLFLAALEERKQELERAASECNRQIAVYREGGGGGKRKRITDDDDATPPLWIVPTADRVAELEAELERAVRKADDLVANTVRVCQCQRELNKIKKNPPPNSWKSYRMQCKQRES